MKVDIYYSSDYEMIGTYDQVHKKLREYYACKDELKEEFAEWFKCRWVETIFHELTNIYAHATVESYMEDMYEEFVEDKVGDIIADKFCIEEIEV